MTAETGAEWKMPEAESQKWLTRVKGYVAHLGWTVSSHGNEIWITRDEPAAMKQYLPGAPNAEEAAKGEPAGNRTLQLALRFAPKLSTDEFERLSAANRESDRKQHKLLQELGLPYKFDSIIASTPEEKRRLQEYRTAVAKLPRHELPDFYTPEHSIYYVHRWHAWLSPADESIYEEWDRIEERLIRHFGAYGPLNSGVGKYVDEQPR
jgi:hypothetical protein